MSTTRLTLLALLQEFSTFKVPLIHGSIKVSCQSKKKKRDEEEKKMKPPHVNPTRASNEKGKKFYA